MKKKCKNCKKEFEPYRWDKKYCSEKCKNTYNNRNKSKAYHLTKPINDILWKNRMILRSFIRNKTVYIKQLKRAGYNFNYFTHEYKRGENVRIFFCYDFGFQQLNSNTLKIIYHGKIEIDESC